MIEDKLTQEQRIRLEAYAQANAGHPSGLVTHKIRMANQIALYVRGIDVDLDDLCKVMHDEYEKAAKDVGWETQSRSQVPWDDVPETNKRTMRRAVLALLDKLEMI